MARTRPLLPTPARRHFCADRDGLFGPDELLLQGLIDNGIPFVIHLP